MKIESFKRDDIVHFLKLAKSEDWVVEQWELDFLLSEYSNGCFTAKRGNGERAGYVTALRHDRSGWIGNLIVESKYRGAGVGERLFVSALGSLRSEGVETFWLTASESGKRLYEKYGFQNMDTITRWAGTIAPISDLPYDDSDNRSISNSLSSIDCKVWGDRRDALLNVTTGRGVLIQKKSGFLVLQPSGCDVLLAPFISDNEDGALRIFNDAIRVIPSGTKYFVDAPLSNKSAHQLYESFDMTIVGQNILMYAGRAPEYRPEMLYGLATMGSCG
jgi:GNAT superfamily N-acetyltransferase